MTLLARMLFMVAMVIRAVAAGAHGFGDPGPDKFLRRLYAPYSVGDARFDPTGKVAPLIFAPRLLRLMRLDAERACGLAGVGYWEQGSPSLSAVLREAQR